MRTWLVSQFLGLPATLFAIPALFDALAFSLDREKVGSVAVGVLCAVALAPVVDNNFHPKE